MLKRTWLWIVAAATAVVGVVLLVLTGQRKAPAVLPSPPPPDRPDTPPVDKPLVTLRPVDGYEASKAPALGPPDAVISRINSRHDS